MFDLDCGNSDVVAGQLGEAYIIVAAVHAKLTEIQALADNIETIADVGTITAAITTLSTLVDELSALAANNAALTAVNAALDDIAIVVTNILAVTAVSGAIANVTAVSAALVGIQTVVDNLEEILGIPTVTTSLLAQAQVAASDADSDAAAAAASASSAQASLAAMEVALAGANIYSTKADAIAALAGIAANAHVLVLVDESLGGARVLYRKVAGVLTYVATFWSDDQALAIDIGTLIIPIGTDLIQTTGYDAVGYGAGVYVADAMADAALATAHPRCCKADAGGRHFRLMPDASGAVGLLSAKASGDADDQPAYDALYAYARAMEIKTIRLNGPTTYFKPVNSETFEGWNGDATVQDGIRPGVKIDASGTQVNGAAGGPYGGVYSVFARGDIVSQHLVTAALAQGAKTIPLDDVTGLAAGDWVLLRLGFFPFDAVETRNWLITRIASIAGLDVTLEEPITFEFTDGDRTDVDNVCGKYLYKITPITDEVDTDFYLGEGPNDTGVSVQIANGAHIKSIVGKGPHQQAVGIQFSKNLTIDKVHIWDNVNDGPNTGIGIRIAESDVYIADAAFDNVSAALIAEAGARMRVGRMRCSNTDVSGQTLVGVGGQSEIHIGDMEVAGLGTGLIIFDSADFPLSQGTVHNLSVVTDVLPNLPYMVNQITGSLKLEVGGAAQEVYNVAAGRWVRRFVPLWNTGGIALPAVPRNCIVAATRLYLSPGATSGVSVSLNYTSFTGGTDYNNELAAGEAKELFQTVTIGSGGLNGTKRKTEDIWLSVGCDEIGGTAGGYYGGGAATPDLSSEFLSVELFVIPEANAWRTGFTDDNTNYWDQWWGGDFTRVPAALADVPAVKVLDPAADATPYFSEARDFKYVMEANRTINTPKGLYPGQTGTIRLVQDGTGSRVAAWGSGWRFPAGAATGGVLSTAGGAVDLLRYTVGEDRKVYAVIDKAMAA